jgi:hypothetical protein
VTAPEFNLARRRGSGSRDTREHRKGGELQGRGTRGGSGAHLCREVWSEDTAYMAAHGCTL